MTKELRIRCPMTDELISVDDCNSDYCGDAECNPGEHREYIYEEDHL